MLKERNILAPKLEKKGHRILWQETDLLQLQVSLPSEKEEPVLKGDKPDIPSFITKYMSTHYLLDPF